jgi:hypothetical protein
MASGTELLQMMLQKRAADQELEIANRQMDLDEKNSRWNRLFTGVNTLANVANTGFDAAGKFTELRDNWRIPNPFQTDSEKKATKEAEAAQADLQTQLDALSQQATADQHMNPALREQYLNEQVGNLEGQRAEEIAGLERDYVGAFNQLDQGNVETPDTAMAPDFSTMPTDLSRDIDSANRDVEQFNQGMIERDARMMSADRDQQSLADAIAEQQAIIDANQPRSQNERDEAERLRLLEETQTREDFVRSEEERAADERQADQIASAEKVAALQADVQRYAAEITSRAGRINAQQNVDEFILNSLAPIQDGSQVALTALSDVLTAMPNVALDETGMPSSILMNEGALEKANEFLNTSEASAINGVRALADTYGWYDEQGNPNDRYERELAAVRNAFAEARNLLNDPAALDLAANEDFASAEFAQIRDNFYADFPAELLQYGRGFNSYKDFATMVWLTDQEMFQEMINNPSGDPRFNLVLKEVEADPMSHVPQLAGFMTARENDETLQFMQSRFDPAIANQVMPVFRRQYEANFMQAMSQGNDGVSPASMGITPDIPDLFVTRPQPVPNPVQSGNRSAQELRSIEQALEEQRKMEEERRRREEEAIDPWLRNIR